jgi:phage terminase large subunit
MAIPKDYVYKPRGGCAQVFTAREPEVLICGPAGTGKSIAILMRLDFMASKYPGSRYLIVRKTRASLTESALVTFEEKVIREGSAIDGALGRINRHSYKYSNGSEIVVGGMDKSEKILSTEYDVIYCQEATELSLEDWSTLSSRCRWFHTPYQMMIADCNPSYPEHWLKKRCDAGNCRLINSDHTDNPVLWDAANQRWTPEGVTYLDKLRRLPPTMRDRLLYNKWTSAEGTVYEQDWKPHGGHVINPIEIPHSWPRYLAIDFGYQSPFVALWGAISPEGVLYIYREWYKTRMTVADHGNTIRNMSQGEPAPVAVICDHDPENRADLEKHTGWVTTNAIKGVEAGIQEVRNRLNNLTKVDGKWVPTLQVFSNCLVEVDSRWADLGEPCGLIAEMSVYSYARKRENRDPSDRPIDKSNHSCDALYYLCNHLVRNASGGARVTDDHIIRENMTNPACRPLKHSRLEPRW